MGNNFSGEERKISVRAKNQRPNPLPEPFKSTPLLSRLDPDGEASQAHSPLFQLPPEIRNQIYAYVFEAGGAVHILCLIKRLAYLRFDEYKQLPEKNTWEKNPPWWQARKDIRRPQYRQGDMEEDGIRSVHVEDVPRIFESGRELLALVKTCRKAYGEALPVLYAGTEFDFTNLHNLRYFFDTVPRCNLEWITSLSIYCVADKTELYAGTLRESVQPIPEGGFNLVDDESQERVWGAVASLPRLRTLAVFIEGCYGLGGFRADRQLEEKMVAPLRKITAPNVFWLILLCEKEQENREPEIEESPFRLLRRTNNCELYPAHNTWPMSDYPGLLGKSELRRIILEGIRKNQSGIESVK